MAHFDKHVIISGSARSGTSWLSETIASQHRYRLLFEPEHETQTAKGHLICDKWIEDRKDSVEAYNYLRKVFQNKVDSDWIAQNSNRKFKQHLWPIVPKKYIIKFVRANLMSNYFNTQFGIPVIHLLRNPYDVLQSQQRVKFPWLTDLSHFVEQHHLRQLIIDNFNFDIENYKQLSHIEILALRWCIENVLPLEVLNHSNALLKIVRYEDLILDKSNYVTLCEELNIEPIEDLDALYRQPSTKTHSKSNILRANHKKGQWGEDDLKKINIMLDIFKCQLYPKTE